MYAAGTATKNISAFDPRALGGCALWLDAADTNTITFTSGSNVATWKDKAEQGLTFAPGQSGAVAAASPTYNATNKFIYFNNGNSGVISAASQGLQATTGWTLPAASEAKSVYIVLNILNGTNSTYNACFRVYKNFATPIPNMFFAIQYVSSTTAQLTTDTYNSVSGVGQRVAETPTGVLSTNATLLTAYVSTRASTNCFVSGILAGSNTTSFTPTVNGSMLIPELSVGAGYDNRCFTGYLHEVIYYNSEHTNIQRQAVEGYLAWKWGLTSALQTGHPYKTTFPILRGLTPNDMSTMPTLWLDSANTGTITSNTSNVTTWSNSGTNGYNASSNAVGSNTGLTGIATQNNTNVLQFSNYSFMSLPAAIFTASERSCFFAFKVQTNISGSYMVLMAAQVGSGGGMEIGIDYSSTNPVFFLQRNGFNPLVSFSTLTTPVNNFWQCSFVNSATTTASNAGSVNGSNFSLMSNALANYTVTDPYYISYSNISRNWQSGDMIIYNNAVSQNEREQIEGYLGWKWGITSLMPTTHPYKYSMPMAVSFNPRFLSNCLFWFDAADATSITSNTSNVTIWANKGIAQVNALSNALYGAPRTGINTINGLNVLNFPAGASMTLASISTPKQARTAFIVSRNLTQIIVGNYQGFFNSAAGAPGAGWQDLYMSYNGANYFLALGRNGDYLGGVTGFFIPSNPLNVVNMYGLVNSVTVGLNVATYNGSTMTLANSIGANAYITTVINPAIIATGPYNTAQDMAEFIQYDYDLSPSDRYRVEGYLAWKWGLASSLPANHPFKKAAP